MISTRGGKDTFWMLDSGASQHFTFSPDDYVEYTAQPQGDSTRVHTANGVTYALGSGTVRIRYLTVDGQDHTITVSPVLYLPQLTSRLLSTGQFLSQGMSVKGTKTSMSIVDSSGDVFMTFYPRFMHDTIFVLYPLHTKANLMALNCGLEPALPHSQLKSAQEQLQKADLVPVTYETLHCRFGHPSRDVLRKLPSATSNSPSIFIPDRDSKPCPGCAQGKMPAAPHPISYRRAESPLELVHSDLLEQPALSYSKFKFAIVFYDDFTSFGWLENLRTKDAAFSAAKRFLAHCKRQFPQYSIQRWMSDSGGECTSNKFRAMLLDEGIISIQTAPYTHQQNGRAERFIRTMRERSQTMAKQACLPDSYWEFALEHAVHVYNRLPVQRLKWKTPFELLHSAKPDVKHIRVFGCGAYVHIPGEVRKNKLQPRAEMMTYLGNAHGGIGFQFMRKPRNVIFISSNALFDELYFPACSTSKRTIRPPQAPKRKTDTPSDDQPDPQGDDDDYVHPPPPDKRRDDFPEDAPDLAAPPSPPPPPPQAPVPGPSQSDILKGRLVEYFLSDSRPVTLQEKRDHAGLVTLVFCHPKVAPFGHTSCRRTAILIAVS